MKKLCSGLIICLIMILLPITAGAYYITGTCGKNLEWGFDMSGLQIDIWGTGDMYEIDTSDEDRWGGMWSALRTVTIESGVTSVGNFAFFGCPLLKTVELPDTLLSIGDGAFYKCEKIEEINIPEGTKKIGNLVFEGTNISDIYVPSTLTDMGAGALTTKGGANVHISDIAAWCNINRDNTDFQSHNVSLYLNDTSLTSVTIPNDVTQISDYAFYGFSNVKTVTIPESVKRIDQRAFSKNVTLNVYENSVAHKYAIENSIPYNIITYPDTTGNKIAISNTQITGNTVSFNANPQTNNELQGTFLVAIYDTNGAFVDVKQYPAEAETNISFDKKDNYDSAKIFWWFDTKSMYPMAECKGIKMSELKEGYTITKNYDETRGSVRITENGREITSAVAGTQVTISVSVNNDYTALSPMVTDMNGNAIDVTDNTFIMPDSDVTVKVVFVDIFSSGTCGINHTLKWTLYDNGTLIISGNGQMQDFASSNETPWSKYKDDIKIVAIQNGVTRISKNAFANCSKIKRVLIDKSVTEIETDAFKGCTDLRRVEYGAAQQNWEELYIGSGNEQIQNAEFIYNSPLTDTAQIDLDYLLYEKQEDTTITITDCLPDAVEINIPGQIEELPVIIIGENAFSGCASLTEIHIPSSVNEIGSQAFYGCNNLINFAIPSSIMRIGEDAFSGCSGLKNIYITDVTKWCEIKFGSSSSNPMYYADNLYVNNVLTTDLIIPNDAISIGEYAFSGCSGLTSVDIPNSVTSIGGSAFYNCNNLQDVHITDIAKWCEVDFSDYDSNPMYYADNLYRPPANATGYE